MLDYDREAAWYDSTRGGEPRANAAADALAALLPAGVRTVVDLAGGTGIVSARLAAHGYSVVVCDRSAGMLRVAAGRLPGRAIAADATVALPFRTGSLDAVTIVWLLHLLPDAAPVLAECARVLRPGGALLTTVDKSAAHRAAEGRPDPDPDTVARATDARPLIERLAAGHGLLPHGETTFPGHGQGRPGSPPVYTLVGFVKPA
ncbi:class I SAM-dependent methyltransferase [Flindersiella endophytica]